MKRVLFGLISLGLPAIAACDPLGTRPGGDYSPATGGGVSFGSIFQLLLALGLVAFLLKWALPKLAGKFTKGLPITSSGGIKVEDSVPFAGGTLYVITARGTSILVSTGAQGVKVLAELRPEPAIVDPFEVELRKAKSSEAPFESGLNPREAFDRLGSLISGGLG